MSEDYAFTITPPRTDTGRVQFIVRNATGRRLCSGLVVDGELKVVHGGLELGFADRLAELCGCDQRVTRGDVTQETPAVQDPPKPKKRRKAKDGSA